MISSGRIIRIKDFAAKGKRAGEISREIGVAENTARKYMREPANPHGLKRRRKPSKLDPYMPYLQERMNQGIFNCVVLMERILAKGYNGSMTILNTPALVMILGNSRTKYVEFTTRCDFRCPQSGECDSPGTARRG